MKYNEWLDEWLALYVKPSAKEQTCDKYFAQVKNHIAPKLGDNDMDELTAVVLQKFVVDLIDNGLAANTVNGIISVIKCSLKRAAALGITNVQGMDAIVRPKVNEKQVECFTIGEQRKIENYISASKKGKLFGIVLCLYTGLRIGELLALTWKDVDFANGILLISKSCHDCWNNGKYKKITETPKTKNSKRYIPLPKVLLAKLKALYKQSDSTYVICGKNKEFGIQVRSYQKTFEKVLEKLGIAHKGFHALRHTFATRALEVGMDVKTLSEIMGHGNPTITLKRYAHSLLEHKTEMMNRLGRLML